MVMKVILVSEMAVFKKVFRGFSVVRFTKKLQGEINIVSFFLRFIKV